MRVALAVPLLFAALAGAGCATKIYQGPTSGRAAEAQIAVATSADRAFEQLNVKPLAGKKVVIEFYGLTERIERDSPEEAYEIGVLLEKIINGRKRIQV